MPAPNAENINLSSPLGARGVLYDYIICGAGCAGLSLLMHLIQLGKFNEKKILLVDKDAKKSNDRTWCFWEQEDNLFAPIVYKQWQQLWFHSQTFSKSLVIKPYTYKLIRGIDFYNYCFAAIARHPNITFLQSEVQSIFSNEKEGTGIVVNGEKIAGQYIFNSILFQKPLLQKHQYWLLQHFTGWVIETEEAAFDASVGTLMDFRTDQSGGATFFYVLPFSPNRALIEYTLFSKEVLPKEAYAEALQNYISRQLKIKNYKVAEEEFGVIPMSNYAFPQTQNKIIHIGTAGGQTKASSGYTFRFIQKQSHSIVESLIKEGHPFSFLRHSARFAFYDSVLLNILHHKTLSADAIFTDLFQKNKPAQVFKFLDNETDLIEELSIISKLPTLPFFKAAVRHLAASVQ